MPRDTEKPEPSGSPEPAPPTLRHPAVLRPQGAHRNAGALPPPPGLSASPDALSLLRAIRRRWLLTLSLGILAAVAAGVAVLALVRTRYVAVATLQIAANPQKLTDRPDWRNDFPSVLKTAAARFKGRDVILKSLSKEQVRDLGIIKRFPNPLATINWLEEEIKVETQDLNELMSVSLPGDDPEDLCVLVNALADSYLAIVQGKESSQRKDRVRKIQAIANDLKEKLADKIAVRQTLLKGQATPGSPTELMRVSSMMQQFAEASRQLYQAQFEADKIRAKIAMHGATQKKLILDDIPDSVLMGSLESDAVIKPKLAQIVLYEKALSRVDSAGPPRGDPTRVGILRSLAKLRAEVEAAREGMKDGLLERYQRKVKAEHAQLAKAFELELEPHENQVKVAQEKYDQLVRETESVGISTSKLDLLNLEIRQLEVQHADVDKQVKSFQVDQESEFRVQIAQEAVWQVKDAKKRLLLMGLAPLLAFAGVAFGVGWWEFRARRIHSADEVALGLGVRVVGAVPASGRRHFVTPLAAGETDDHNLVESIDAIRTTLLRNASVEATQVVMVTSAVGGEGKTTLSSNLAVSLARAGRRTLLVDCDLRSPALHQLFEQTLQPGFSEVVLGEVELPDAVRPTTTDENLWLLPAGQWDREVLQELARDSVGSIFGRLKEEFDFVVIDSHPVLPATDSLLIGQHVDAVILSVMRGVSQTPRVHTAHERLATLGIRVFGAVVTGMPNEVYQQRYQYRQPTAAAA